MQLVSWLITHSDVCLPRNAYKGAVINLQWSRSALYCPFVLKRAFLSQKILYCPFKDSLWPLLPFFDNIYCKFLSIFSKSNIETGLVVNLSLGFVPHLPNKALRHEETNSFICLWDEFLCSLHWIGGFWFLQHQLFAFWCPLLKWFLWQNVLKLKIVDVLCKGHSRAEVLH